MSYCYQADQLREAAGVLENYVDLENELINLAGFNLLILIDKLKAGYTIQAPEENLTPHLVNISVVSDWEQRSEPVYAMGIDVEWDDLTDYEKRKLYESQHYLLYQKKY